MPSGAFTKDPRETIVHRPAWVRRRKIARQFATAGAAGMAGMASRLGYAGQPHMVDDFRSAGGITPGGHLRSLRRIDHPEP